MMTQIRQEEMVSVIIPIYNKEPYLKKCVDSVLGQTYENIEILLIDDGSTDGSSEICNEYAACENRVRTVHCENSGPSCARNIGLCIMKGSYIAFIDADDYIEKDYLEKLMLMESDFTVCGFRHIYDRGTKEFVPKGQVLDSRKELIEALSDRRYTWCQLIWAKLYRADIIKEHSIRFTPETVFGEDLEFNIRYASYIQRGVILSEILYNNVIIDGTLSRRYGKDLWASMSHTIDVAYEVCRQEQLTDTFMRFFTKRVKVMLYQECATPFARFSKQCDQIKKDRHYSPNFWGCLTPMTYDYMVMRLLEKGRFRTLYALVKIKRFIAERSGLT